MLQHEHILISIIRKLCRLLYDFVEPFKRHAPKTSQRSIAQQFHREMRGKVMFRLPQTAVLGNL